MDVTRISRSYSILLILHTFTLWGLFYDTEIIVCLNYYKNRRQKRFYVCQRLNCVHNTACVVYGPCCSQIPVTFYLDMKIWGLAHKIISILTQPFVIFFRFLFLFFRYCKTIEQETAMAHGRLRIKLQIIKYRFSLNYIAMIIQSYRIKTNHARIILILLYCTSNCIVELLIIKILLITIFHIPQYPSRSCPTFPTVPINCTSAMT